MGPFCLLVMIAFLESLAEKIWEVSGWTCQRIFRELRCVLSSKELEQQTQYNVYHQYQKEKKKLQESYAKKQAQAQKSSHVSKQNKSKLNLVV